MPLKRYKPTTPGRRHSAALVRRDRGVAEPVRTLLSDKRGKAGRNSAGKITVRHRGGGHKRMLRHVDFVQPVLDRPAQVLGIQYDPNRSADIALLVYPNGQKAYTLAVADLKAGDTVTASRAGALPIERGNRMALKHIPAGMLVSNIEIFPGRAARIARSAGSAATVLS
ncbi:MAG: 50S ribosomal protein L2, partial [Candidatus Micrarchaeota archaeon]|nr:50S ribosomal protein L2 [Candidatus Micrarchaeota archaeon]